MKTNKMLLELLEKSEFARNCGSNDLQIEFLCEYICKDKLEKQIIRDVLSRKAPNGASLKRERAHIQNTLGLYTATEQVKQNRDRQEKETRESFSPINELVKGFFRFFK